jgi:hypothetical protein
MTERSDPVELPSALEQYADRLLAGTGLSAAEALLIARGERQVPEVLGELARAIRAGWGASERCA